MCIKDLCACVTKQPVDNPHTNMPALYRMTFFKRERERYTPKHPHTLTHWFEQVWVCEFADLCCTLYTRFSVLSFVRISLHIQIVPQKFELTKTLKIHSRICHLHFDRKREWDGSIERELRSQFRAGLVKREHCTYIEYDTNRHTQIISSPHRSEPCFIRRPKWITPTTLIICVHTSKSNGI